MTAVEHLRDQIIKRLRSIDEHNRQLDNARAEFESARDWAQESIEKSRIEIDSFLQAYWKVGGEGGTFSPGRDSGMAGEYVIPGPPAEPSAEELAQTAAMLKDKHGGPGNPDPVDSFFGRA